MCMINDLFKIEEKKKLIYPIAAEIKLLVDTPEQVNIK